MRIPIGVFERVEVKGNKGEWQEIKAKIDTGAFRTSIDEGLAQNLGLLSSENILGYQRYRNALGRFQERVIISLVLKIRGTVVVTQANVTDRSHMNYELLVGRRDLGTFTVEYDPASEIEKGKIYPHPGGES